MAETAPPEWFERFLVEFEREQKFNRQVYERSLELATRAIENNTAVSRELREEAKANTAVLHKLADDVSAHTAAIFRMLDRWGDGPAPSGA